MGVIKMCFSLLLTFFLVFSVESTDVPRIKNITSGPYQKYSNQPLISLGDGYYYFESAITANWYGAMEFCRNIGLHLVAIEAEPENTLIVDYIASIGYADYWTGGSALSNNGGFRWIATGEPLVYGDWHSGEPNGFFSDAVTMMRYLDGQLKWNDENPYDVYHFICERVCDQVCTV